MSSIQAAEHLRSHYNFNCVPLLNFSRVTKPDGTQVKQIQFEKGYDAYRSELYPLEKWPSSAPGLAIITGHISNLTVVDLDDETAASYITNHTGCTLLELSELVVQTSKGYQLFYTYTPDVRTTTGLDNLKLDILNDGRQTFAWEINPGYTVLKSGLPQTMPESLKEFLLKDSLTLSTQSFFLEEEKLRSYRNPLVHVLHEAMGTARLSKILKQKLEKIFCSGDFAGKELDGKFSGREDSFLTHCIGILAHDLTVDEETFQEFMPWMYEKLIRAKTSKEELWPKYLAIPFERKWWEYDPQWSAKTENALDFKVHAGAKNIKMWADPETGLYAFYDMDAGELYKQRKPFFIDRAYNILGMEVDTRELDTIKDVFTPEVAEEFYYNDRGTQVHNLFSPPKWMSYFLCPQVSAKSLPYYTGKLLENLFPEKDVRDGFLHNLAHHLRYRQFSPTAWIITGAEGSGKNMFFGHVIAQIYERYFNTVAVSALTGVYQDPLLSKLFVLIDEAEDEKKTYQATTLITALKRIVGNEMLSGRAIYKGIVEQKNHLFLVLVSNEEMPVQLSGAKDRRFNVSHTGPNLQELPWYQAIPNIDLPHLLQEELEEFVAYLSSLKTEAALTRKIYLNNARAQLVDVSIPLTVKIAEALYQRNPDLLPVEVDDELVDCVHTLQKYNLAYLEISRLKELLPFHSQKVSKLLTKKGIRAETKWIQGRNCRVLILNETGVYQKEETLKISKPNLGESK